jgi:adenylate kinase
MGKQIIITGIATAGKSYLARQLAERTNGIFVDMDKVRDSMQSDPQLEKWVNFYWNKNELEYLTNTSPDEMWTNIVRQSEAFWPVFLEKINSYKNETRPVIFESVNLLPHLVYKDLKIPCIVLVGSSYEEILERNIREPRWGSGITLQTLEAKIFFEIERPKYIQEANIYDYPVFNTPEQAMNTALNLLNN